MNLIKLTNVSYQPENGDNESIWINAECICSVRVKKIMPNGPSVSEVNMIKSNQIHFTVKETPDQINALANPLPCTEKKKK